MDLAFGGPWVSNLFFVDHRGKLIVDEALALEIIVGGQ